MHKIKSFFQWVEWIMRYALLSPGQRLELLKGFKPRSSGGKPGAQTGVDAPQEPARLRFHWVGEACPALPQQERSIPLLVPPLMRLIIASVITLTALSLWFASRGSPEALYEIPFFVIAVLVLMLHRGLKRWKG